MSATNARATEKLLALLRFEMTQGTLVSEMLQDLLRLVHEIVLDDDSGDGDRVIRQSTTTAEALLCAMVTLGHEEKIAEFIEGWARSRAQCDAAFGGIREVPF